MCAYAFLVTSSVLLFIFLVSFTFAAQYLLSVTMVLTQGGINDLHNKEPR